MEEIVQLMHGSDLSIHVVVPGNEQDIQQMKEELGLSYEINNDPELSLHKAFNLTVTEGGYIYALRGYAIVKNGKVTKTHEMVEIGVESVELVQEALKK